MAKKMYSLAADLEGLNNSADDKMFETLRTSEQGSSEVRPFELKIKTRNPEAPSESKQEPKTSVAATTEVRRKKERPKTQVESKSLSLTSIREFLNGWLNCWMTWCTSFERTENKSPSRIWLRKHCRSCYGNTHFADTIFVIYCFKEACQRAVSRCLSSIPKRSKNSTLSKPCNCLHLSCRD